MNEFYFLCSSILIIHKMWKHEFCKFWLTPACHLIYRQTLPTVNCSKLHFTTLCIYSIHADTLLIPGLLEVETVNFGKLRKLYFQRLSALYVAVSLEKSNLNFSKIQNQIEYEENCLSCVVLLFHHADTTFSNYSYITASPNEYPTMW